MRVRTGEPHRSRTRALLAVLAAGAIATSVAPARAGGNEAESESFRGAAGEARAPTPIEHAIEVDVAAEPEPEPLPESQAAAGGPRDADPLADDELEIELDDRPTSFPDPFENLNRRTLSLNQTIDRWVLDPVTDTYVYVVPDRAQQSVRHFFANLESPAIFVNDVLQGELGNAATTVARFSVNTVFGLAGFFDPATAMGLERHDADFGQTLAGAGFGSGPFLIVPVLGPTTVRDGIGTLVDVAMQPAIYLLGPTPLVVASVQEGTEGLTLRAQHGDDLKRLEEGSLDYYAALRSAYYQNRMATLGELSMEPASPAPSASASPAQAVASTPEPDDPT